MMQVGNDPHNDPDLAARNRRMAIGLGLFALLMYVVFIVGYAL